MRRLPAVLSVLLAAAPSIGCSEYRLKGDQLPDGLPDPDAPGAEAGPGDSEDPRDPLDAFPGEERPPQWPEWSSTCSRGGFGVPGGGAGVERYTVDAPIDELVVLLTVGDVEIVPRPGPVEVELHGVRTNGAQGASVSNGRLTLDYSASIGDLVVYAPPDLLSYDFRLCVGALGFSGLEGQIVAEVRLGDLAGDDLAAERLWTHNQTGDVEVGFAREPEQVWMDGGAGQSAAAIPAQRCDCDLGVTGPGFARLDGITDDPTAPLEVWVRRQIGSVWVRGR